VERNPWALTQQEYDLVIVGSDIVGICAAWDAVQRGLIVALVERGDFGHAASANHFKVVHGGIRYLQHADLARVRAANSERNVLLRMAPHLVRPMPVVAPVYGQGLMDAEYRALGLGIYNLLTLDRNCAIGEPANRIPPAHMISRQECLHRFPYLEPAGLRGAAVFYDGQIYNPARLSLAAVRAAAEAGADVINYAEVTGYLRRGDHITGVRVMDRMSGDCFDVRAKVVLNATGPWAKWLGREKLALTTTPGPGFSRDAYFIVGRRLSGEQALAVQGLTHDPDVRVSRGHQLLFLVPWRRYTQVGVWHKVHCSRPDEVALTEQELQRFIDEVNAVAPGLQLSLDDVTRCHAGLTRFDENRPTHLRYRKRPLLLDHARGGGLQGLISLMDVCNTMARSAAANAIDLVYAKLGRQAPRCKTAETPVYGGDFESFEGLIGRVKERCSGGWCLDTITALVRNYGAAYNEVLAYVKETPELGESIDWTTVIKAEVVHAVREEMAQRLDDVVLRRTDLGGGEYPGEEALRVCADLMGAELGWDQRRKEEELAIVRLAYPKNGAQIVQSNGGTTNSGGYFSDGKDGSAGKQKVSALNGVASVVSDDIMIGAFGATRESRWANQKSC
jgi:glycerol-3-phosphate dehydrogenase